MRKGPHGTTALNPMLQALLNPPARGKAELPRHAAHAAAAGGGGEARAAAAERGRVFRVGDRVLQLVNNYDKEVFNGDQGRVGAGRWVVGCVAGSVDAVLGWPVRCGALQCRQSLVPA